jgi:Flp pilus assembly protein TadG
MNKVSSVNIPPRAARALRRRAQRGVAAIEAMMVLPLMVFIIIGGIELYAYIRVTALMDRVAYTVANAISLQQSMSADTSVCTAPDHACTYGTLMTQLMTPMNYAAKGGLIVSVYATDAPAGSGAGPTAWQTISGAGTGWTRTYQGASAPAPTTRITPTILNSLNMISRNSQSADTMIVVEVFYDYQPFSISGAFFGMLGGQRHMYSHAIIRPRYKDLCILNDLSSPPPAGTVCG